jgi:ABC-2 type transport system permease protein
MAQASRTLPVSGPWGGGSLRSGLKTIILRECAVIARFWTVTLAPPLVTTLLYFAIFGEILGKRIGSFSGIDYIRYLSPGS